MNGIDDDKMEEIGLPDQSKLEALMIYGDATQGPGIMPQKIEVKIKEAG